MRTHPWLLAVGFVGVLGAGITLTQWTRWGLVALIATVALGWLVSFRCTHRFATLQPPVHGAGPERDHARWYCDRCGKTWDSGLEPSTRPRVIYHGYDENKAVKSAARADALDKQRRRLATKRGSVRQRPARSSARSGAAAATAASRPGPRPVEVMLESRAVGYTDDEFARPLVARR